jgi:hypothetical protein
MGIVSALVQGHDDRGGGDLHFAGQIQHIAKDGFGLGVARFRDTSSHIWNTTRQARRPVLRGGAARGHEHDDEVPHDQAAIPIRGPADEMDSPGVHAESA